MNNYMRNRMDRIISLAERHSQLGWEKFDFEINRIAERAEFMVLNRIRVRKVSK